MSATLFIRLPMISRGEISVGISLLNDSLVDCLYVSASNQELLMQNPVRFVDLPKELATLESNPAFTKNFRVIALLPAKATLQTTVSVTSKQSRYLRQAVPYLLEESFAEDVETMHFAWNEAKPNHRLPIVAASKALIVFWKDAFQAIHLALDALISELEGMPDEFALTAYVTNERVLLRSDAGSMQCSPASADIAIQSMIKQLFLADSPSQANQKKPLLQIHAEQGLCVASQQLIDRIRKQYGNELKVEINSIEKNEFIWLCEQLQKKPEQQYINLLQGGFRVQKNHETLLHRFRLPLILLLSWLGIQIAINFSYASYLQHHASNLEMTVTEEFKKLFPKEKVVNLRRQIKARISSASATNENFFSLLDPVVKNILADLDLPTINSLNYSNKRNEIIIDLLADSFEKLDSLKKRLTDAGLIADLSSVVNEKDIVSARITISRK